MSDSHIHENYASQPEPAMQGSSELSAGGEAQGEPLSAHRGRWFLRVFVFLMLLAALVALASYASQWKKKVLVRGFVVDGASIVSDRELLSRISAFKGSNLQKLDTRELKQRIMALPYLREAEISKELNGIVRIRVFERKPVAQAIIAGRIMAIDDEGFLLPERSNVADRFPDLLKITGITRIQAAKNGLQKIDRRDVELIRQFLDALAQSDYARLLIRELHLAPNNMSWCIAVQVPARFIVGNDGNFKEKLKKFEIFWQKVVSKKGFDSYEAVDLRFRDRIFTRVPVSPEALQDVSL
jgi:cell division protein FtsQ